MNQEERRQKVFAKGHKGSKDTGHTEHGNFR